MSTNINSTEQIVEINAGDQITNVNIVSQSTTQVISGEQVVTVDVNAGTIPAAWGSITGTLSNQTDLQNALNAKQNNITLTTTGTTGVATLVGATLNIPNYVSSTKQTEWDSAYNDKINSAEVSGTTTKTLTLTQQDGGIIQASWSDFDTAPVTSVFGRTGDVVAAEGDYNINQLGDVTITSATNGQVLKYNGTAWVNAADASGLTSVGLAMPSAFTVSGSPLTSNGTITVTGAGTTSQYVRGDGSLAAFPSVSNEAKTLIREVYNKTGATLTKGTVIYIDGGQGNLPTVTKAIATGDPTSAQTFGIVQSDITNMNNGFVVVAGGIDNLDTQAYTEGTALYLSPTTAGAWTSTKPYAPDHMVYLGVVVRSHPTQGVIEVKIQNGVELDEIHNVSARFPVNKDGLFYNSTSEVWENKSIAGVLGYTPVPETRIITINGTAQNLSADRTWNVGTVTSVAASGGTGISISGSPVTGSGTINITNTAPDQIVSLTGAGTTLISGTYPNFTVTSNDQYVGTVTSVNATVPTGFEVSGVPITSSGTVDIKFASGYSLPTNAKQTQWDDAYAKRIDSLTVTGNSGSATLTSNVLNVPTYTLTGLGGEPAITAGTTLQYWRGDKSFQTLDTSVVPENGNVYFTEPRVRATVLSGLNITGGSISASDSVLNAFGKVQNQINGLIGGSIFQSTWNASTNTPSLASGVGTKGYYYIVSVAGTTNLDGITDWQIGDWAIFDGTVWRKVDNTDAVVSVNGYTGVVSLVLDDLADVSAASPTSNQLLRFNGTSSKWENWTPNYLTTITLTGDVTGTGTSSIATTIGAGKVTNAMLAGSIDYAKMNAATVPTWNQDTTGNAATADKWKTARTLTIGATGKSVDGSGNVTWSASDIGLTNYLPLTGGTLTGSLTIEDGGAADNTTAFGSYKRLIFDNAYNNVARGPNKITLFDAGGTSTAIYGLGINNGALSFYSDSNFEWYRPTSRTAFTKTMSLNNDGNLNVLGTITASNFSGSSSGTNTGDQDLSGYVTLTTAQNITGSKTFRSVFGGGTGDFTDITTPILKISPTTGFWRIPFISNDENISGVFNFQTGKNVYWGEPDDTGTYFFRGRAINVRALTGTTASFNSTGDSVVIITGSGVNLSTYYAAKNSNNDQMQVGILGADYTSASYPALVGRGAYLYSPRTLGLVAETGYPIYFQTGGAIRLTIATGGAATFSSTISATNFSGSSSGTNTGDQDLSGLVTLGTAQTITAVKTFNENVRINTDTNPSNLSGKQLVLRADSANGGQSLIAMQGYDKTTRWVLNVQDAADTYHYSLYSNSVTIGTTPSYQKRFELSQTGVLRLPAYTTNGFVKFSGGDGTLSVDTNTYLTTTDASNTYLPLTGGALSSSATGGILSIRSTSASGYSSINFLNNSGTQTGSIGWGNATVPDVIGRNALYIYSATEGISFLTDSAGISRKMYLNNAGNLGLGVTPSAWSLFTTLQLGGNTYAAVASSNTYLNLSTNVYYDGSAFKYITTGVSTRYQQSSGGHYWYSAASGSAGTTATHKQFLVLDSSGNLGLGDGVSPSAWASGTEGALQIKNAGFYGYSDFEAGITANAYYNSGWKRIVAQESSMIILNEQIDFRVTETSTANSTITWTTPLSIANTGEVSFTSIARSWSYSSPSTNYKNIDWGGGGVLYRDSYDSYLTANCYYSTGGWKAKYTHAGGVGVWRMLGGDVAWHTYNGSVTAGSVYTLSDKFFISKAGNVGIGEGVDSFPSGDALLIKNSGVWNVSIGLQNTGTGGRKWNIFSTNNSFGQGGGKFLIYNATGDSDAMVIDSNNNVGIQTVSPGVALDVNGRILARTDFTVGYGTAQNYGILNVWRTTAGNSSGVIADFTNGTDMNFNIRLSDVGATSKFAEIVTYTTEPLRINSSGGGAVGIGTTNTTGLSGKTLYIRASSTNAGQSAIAIQDYNQTNRWAINGQDGASNYSFNIYSAPTGTNDFTRRLRIGQDGVFSFNSTDTTYTYNFIGGSMYIPGGQSGASTAAYTAWNQLVFGDQYSDVARGPNKIVTYGRGGGWVGGIGIHNDTQAYYAGGTHKFYKFDGTTATLNLSLDGSGNLTATGGFFESSDIRLKKNVQEYLNTDILNIGTKIYEKNGKLEIGYIAQDFENILPDVLSKNEDGYLTLSYREVHTAKIAALENEIKLLKEKLK